MTEGAAGTYDSLIRAITAAAADWADIDYPVRRAAEEVTLDASNRFTQQALAFAINQQMSLLSPNTLREWIPAFYPKSYTVGVLNPGNIPFVGLQDFLAVLLCGHAYCGTVSSRSPALLPSFSTDLLSRIEESHPRPGIEFTDFQSLLSTSDAVIASGHDATMDEIGIQCARAGLASDHILLRGNRYTVAVVSGKETEAQWEGLAEDMLMHEGAGCRNVAIIWAPSGTSPDPVLAAMARFRAVYPTHPDTAGSLQMTKAFLKAVDQPHAHGENLEFLVSKGDPEIQIPGHVRWTEFNDFAVVSAWLESNANSIQLIVTPEALQAQIPDGFDIIQPGFGQRPPLAWNPDGISTVEFLSSL